MSSIKLKHSGGNSVIIAAPSSNPASDRTLTLPGDADGTILTSNSSVGKIVAYESFVWTTHTSVGAISSRPEISSSLRFTYTPTSATSKIILRYNLRVSLATNAVSMFFIGKDVSNYSDMQNSEYVNSPAASTGGSGSTSGDDGNSVAYGGNSTNGEMRQVTLMAIETAGNTNQRIYSVHGKNTSGGTTHFNRWISNSYYGTSFGELFEVAA
tara:strand:+ start:452 stop:1087 length:636 start_codon:yes stop_codon:yes gene_type:complete